jgi:hypothetical protein
MPVASLRIANKQSLMNGGTNLTTLPKKAPLPTLAYANPNAPLPNGQAKSSTASRGIRNLSQAPLNSVTAPNGFSN